ncbi:MAG TPA: radical SAM protein [Firmicutes bacterium]|nr:radical SAM protein [Bacillota bacterium]
MRTTELAYFASFFFRNIIGQRGEPLILGLGVTNRCNLLCQHCVFRSDHADLSYERAVGLIRCFYRQGARILFIQGGEPFLWKDAGRTIEDLIHAAKNEGYFRVAVATNGTFPLDTAADLVWVSVDGGRKNHNRIRDGSYDAVLKNLIENTHPRVNINMTINRLNQTDLEKVAALARDLPAVQGVSFNFHTPFPGVEDLAISVEEKRSCITRIIKLKKSGYPVINSYTALQGLQWNNYPRPVSLICLIEKGVVYSCCFGRTHPVVCRDCGYGIVAELSLLSQGNLKVIPGALRLFR